MSKRKRRVFSREFKLSAVQRMLAGESTKALSRERLAVICDSRRGRSFDRGACNVIYLAQCNTRLSRALWTVAIRGREKCDKSIDDRTYAGAGSGISYLVAGRKP